MARWQKHFWIGFFILAAMLIFIWPRTRGPIFEGRSIEAWLKDYDELRNINYYDSFRAAPASQQKTVSPDDLKRIESVFQRMGTNAVPCLAGRINHDYEYSRMELWRIENHGRLPQLLKRLLPRPKFKFIESNTAAHLMSAHVQPPGEMLIPLITPSLESSNSSPRIMALLALRGISSGYGLARPYLEQGLKDTNTTIQRLSADVIRRHGTHQKWAVSSLLALADSPNFDTHQTAIAALDALGTNSLPAIPRLKEMRAREQDRKRRLVLANGIDHIVGSVASGPPK